MPFSCIFTMEHTINKRLPEPYNHFPVGTTFFYEKGIGVCNEKTVEIKGSFSGFITLKNNETIEEFFNFIKKY